MMIPQNQQNCLSCLGFGVEKQSVHTSRTLMFAELSMLLESLSPQTRQDEYKSAIIDENILGKRTASNRKETAKFLTRLYGLEPNVLLFRIFRYYWELDTDGRPVLAGLYANARDSILQISAQIVIETEEGNIVSRQSVEHLVQEKYPNRFSPASCLSISQNVMSSWKQIGYLQGRTTVSRKTPLITPVNTAFALFLGYCSGFRDNLLFETFWTYLLHLPNHILHEMTSQASQRGLLRYKNIGGILEVDFSALLTTDETEALRGQD